MKFRYFNLLACTGAMAALCLQSSQAEAIFASVKSTGMAATSISYPLDSLAGAYNPAGNAVVGDRIDIEGAWVHNTGHAKLEGNTIFPPGTELNPLTNGKFSGMQFKNVFPASFGINKVWCVACDWEIATGLIVYNRNFQKTTYSQPLPLLGTSKAGLEYVNQTISPIVAIRWCNSHSIGISANYQIERIKVNGLQNFDHLPTLQNPTGTLFPGHVTNRGYNYATGWGFTIGYYGQITDALAIGVTYQPKTTMTRLDKYKGFLSQRGKLDIPRKIGMGISYRITPCLAVAFDVEQIQWKKVKALSNPLLQPGALLPGILGTENGPGFGFRDQWYYRVGLEWAVDECWTLRCGFRHANTPIKSSQTAVNVLTLDCVENFVTAGATWNLNCCNEISVMGAWGFEKTVKGKGSIPVLLGGGEASLTEQKYAIGLAWGWKF